MKSARQEILDKLKNLQKPVPEKPDFSEPVFHEINRPLDVVFKEKLEEVNGAAHIFSNEEELLKALKDFLRNYKEDEVVCSDEKIGHLLDNHDVPFSASFSYDKLLPVSITECEFLIAHTGSVMVSSAQPGERNLFAYPEVHVVLARQEQLVKYLEDAYNAVLGKYNENLPSQISLITGPSRTADIEKTLTLGAHGPKELHVFLH